MVNQNYYITKAIENLKYKKLKFTRSTTIEGEVKIQTEII